MAKLTFFGSAEYVTGSAYLLETEKTRILLECGLFQGGHEEEELNAQPLPFDIHKLDAVILSHAHLDHSGRLPKLAADGYSGPIYMTPPTGELLEIMLKDAAFLEAKDKEWENRRRVRSGKPEIEPLFTLDDVHKALGQISTVDYNERTQVAPGIELRYQDAGHILGSAIVEIFIQEHGRERKLVFSGDLGNSCAALLRDPARIEEADVLLLESTYGDRDHRSMQETLEEFQHIIAMASQDNGNVLIPSFAVGRAQEIIFNLGEMYQAGKLPQQAVYLDSPMAIAATEIYHRYQDVFNREDKARMRHARSGSLHAFLPILRYSHTAEESMAINRIKGGAIVIAGSGMCTGGRIRHHLKHNLWRSNTHVVIVGFQARGTPGRALVDGAQILHLAGEEIVVKAKIHTLGGFSAHASQSQLLAWADNFKQRPRLYLVHGETEAKIALQQKLAERGWHADIPHQHSVIEL